MKSEWVNKKDEFEVVDVRKATSNFLPGLLMKAQKVSAGKGICVIQTFEPKPLYSAMDDLGFESYTEKISENEYRVYFYRINEKEITFKNSADMPFKPTAILNYKKIDNDLAKTVVDFWELTWEKKDSAIDLKTKLLLSLSNAVGSSRFRQATREMIKAYSLGTTVAELDELFSLFAWNQGIGNFSSEIGPSPLYKTYQYIKTRKNSGASREEIMNELLEKFGDKNPEVGTN